MVFLREMQQCKKGMNVMCKGQNPGCTLVFFKGVWYCAERVAMRDVFGKGMVMP